MLTGIKINFQSVTTLLTLGSIKRKQCKLNIYNGILSPFNCLHPARLTLRVFSALPPPSLLSASTRRCKMPQIRPGLGFRHQITPIEFSKTIVCRSMKEMFKQMLTGAGSRFNGGNRWFDKTVQVRSSSHLPFER